MLGFIIKFMKKHNIRNIFQIFIYNTILTLILLNNKNKSNFSPYIIIPLIVSITTKYLFGDWDKGYLWTKLDILYWVSILLYSAFIIFSYKHFF